MLPIRKFLQVFFLIGIFTFFSLFIQISKTYAYLYGSHEGLQITPDQQFQKNQGGVLDITVSDLPGGSTTLESDKAFRIEVGDKDRGEDNEFGKLLIPIKNGICLKPEPQNQNEADLWVIPQPNASGNYCTQTNTGAVNPNSGILQSIKIQLNVDSLKPIAKSKGAYYVRLKEKGQSVACSTDLCAGPIPFTVTYPNTDILVDGAKITRVGPLTTPLEDSTEKVTITITNMQRLEMGTIESYDVGLSQLGLSFSVELTEQDCTLESPNINVSESFSETSCTVEDGFYTLSTKLLINDKIVSIDEDNPQPIQDLLTLGGAAITILEVPVENGRATIEVLPQGVIPGTTGCSFDYDLNPSPAYRSSDIEIILKDLATTDLPKKFYYWMTYEGQAAGGGVFGANYSEYTCKISSCTLKNLSIPLDFQYPSVQVHVVTGDEPDCTPRTLTVDLASAPPTPTPTIQPQGPPCRRFILIEANGVDIPGSEGDYDFRKPPINNEGKPLDFRCIETDSAIGRLGVDPGTFVSSLLGFLLSISGAIALIMILRSAYQLMIASGNPEQIQEAKERITSAIVGLLFIILSLVMLQVIGVDILKLPGFGN